MTKHAFRSALRIRSDICGGPGAHVYWASNPAFAKTPVAPTVETHSPQMIERGIQRDMAKLLVRATVYLKKDVLIAEVEPSDADESRDASKSLSTGLN